MDRRADRGTAPWVFLALTLAYTWIFLGAAYLIGGNWLSFPTVVFVVIGLLGPAVVATALVWSGRSQETVRGFWKRVFDGRGVSLRWYGVIGVLAVSPFLAARLIQEGTSAGIVAGAPPLAFAAISVFAGVIEEPGWRGYALDSLIRRRPVLLMSLVVGVFWSAWHLPLFFIEGSYHHGLGFATTAFWLFMINTVVLAVIYGWIYASTGSLFAVVFFHILQDLGGEILSLDGAERIELWLWLLAAVTLTVVSRDVMLSRLRRIPLLRPTRSGGRANNPSVR